MGAMPQWYVLIKAAQWLQVPPWELLARPTIWTTWATEAMAAEATAAKNASGSNDLM